MSDLLIKNALIYDGSGEPAFMGNVAVTDGKIETVGDEMPSAREVIDADGLSLAPGFIDSHSHADLGLEENPNRLHVLRMGVTTEIAGQCGHSREPVSDDLAEKARATLPVGKKDSFFSSFAEEKEAFSRLELGTNLRCFTGHGILRCVAMGSENRKAAESEIKTMTELLVRDVRAGSLGVSTGLSYVPGIYSDTEELIEVVRPLKEVGGIYTTHSRSESMGLYKCIEECIAIAANTGVPVNISHFKCAGKVFWERCEKALKMIDAAVAAGNRLTLDAYPYTAVSTTNLSSMPPKFLDQGPEAFAKMLEKPEIVEAIRREIFEVNDPSWDNAIYYVGLENFLIIHASETPWAVGKTYAQIGKEQGRDPFDVLMELLRKNHGYILECRFAMCEENVEMILKHPLCTVGSDGLYGKGQKICHPRAFGTFPRYLGRYIRQKKILSREEGIRRITSMPAQRYHLNGKGFLRPGNDADMVLLDYENILDHADYLDPFKPNDGIARVFMNGNLVLKDNEPTGNWCGKFL